MDMTKLGWVGILFLMACGGTVGAVQLRAASDFHCDRTGVVVTSVGGSGYRAEGCGREATYVCVRDGQVVCTRDSDIETTVGMEAEVAEMDEVRRAASPLCRAVSHCIGLVPVVIRYEQGTATDISLSPGTDRTCVARAVLSHPSPESDGDVRCPSPAPVPETNASTQESPAEASVPAAEPSVPVEETGAPEPTPL